VPRTDDDSWEITESVGATALGVAAARAADTESVDPLIDDPFARVFLEAAGDGMWNWFGSSEIPPEILEAEPDVPVRMQGMRDFEEREDVGEWFGGHGWNVTVTTTPELMASHDRRPPEEVQDTTPHNLFVSAERSSS
jgi:O-methyltransferase involved in polyketide biosynthesis